jgi:hypothetical protein
MGIASERIRDQARGTKVTDRGSSRPKCSNEASARFA